MIFMYGYGWWLKVDGWWAMADFLYSRLIPFFKYIVFVSMDSCDDFFGSNFKYILNFSEDEEEDCDEDLLENREK